MNIVGYIGSPHKTGSTAWTVNRILESAGEQGANTRTFYASEMNVKPCQGCLVCVKGGGCAVQDDMQQIYAALKTTDVLVIGSPIYMGQMSAQTKAFTDRLFAQIKPRFSPAFKEENAGKKLILVWTQGNPDGEKFKAYLEYTKLMFAMLEFDVLDEVVVTGTRTETANEQAGLADTLKRIGARLAASQKVTSMEQVNNTTNNVPDSDDNELERVKAELAEIKQRFGIDKQEVFLKTHANITLKEFCAMLSGRDCQPNLTPDERLLAEQRGFVVVYGDSDDRVEFEGAITAEGHTNPLAKDGSAGVLILSEDGKLIDEDSDLYVEYAKKNCNVINVFYCCKDGLNWAFESDIPHETFLTYDGGYDEELDDIDNGFARCMVFG